MKKMRIKDKFFRKEIREISDISCFSVTIVKGLTPAVKIRSRFFEAI